ncbi:MAG: FtsX-like permease family protein [Acidobacteriaceae bacterium]|nr:FtsX-like permease family protein [Acidobacteriaceae bacterium]
MQESSFGLPGKTFKPGQKPTSDWAMTSDGYFKTIGLPLLKGRAFTRDEALSDIPQVAVVNRAFVRLYWPAEDPIGKEIRFGDPERSMKVIGVVGNEHQMGPDQPEHPEFYIPGHEMRDLYVVVRTAADPASVLLTLKQPVWSIDKDQAVDVATEEDALRDWAAPRRFNMTVLAAFGVAALLLAAVGLFSVLAYSVTLRTREIGVRVALGAEPRKVASRIVREGFLMTATGIVLGACCALALTRFMQTVVFGVSTFDPVTFIGAALLLAAVSLLASYIPAMRAARIDPVDALRQE